MTDLGTRSRSTTPARRHALLPAVLTGAVLAGGCISQTTRTVDEPIETFTTKDVSSDWSYSVTAMEVSVAEDTAKMPVRVGRAHRCTTTEHEIVERSKETISENERPGGTWLLGIATTACAGLVAGGVSWGLAGDEPFTGADTSTSTDRTTLEGPGIMTVVGSLCAAPLLAGSLTLGIRSIDRSERIGRVEETDTDEEMCDVSRAPAGVPVQLVGPSGAQVAAGHTDADGDAVLEFPLRRAQGERELLVAGQAPYDVEALDAALDQFRAEVRKRNEKRQAEHQRAMREQEQETGQCAQDHLRMLERQLQVTDQVFLDGLSEPDSVFRRVGHDFVVADADGAEVTLQPLSSGEYHIYAAGLGEVELSVTDPRGNAATLASPYARVIHAPSVDSRVVRTNVLDRYDIKVTGEGCTLVVVYERF